MAFFPTPSQLFATYKNLLKSLRPDINVNDNNSDFIIRGRVWAGIASGIYGDQKKINDDTYIQSARSDALDKRGADLGLPRLPATFSHSEQVRFSGSAGSIIPAGTILRYSPSGVLYQTDAQYVIDFGGTVYGSVTAQVTGQIGNILAPDTLDLISPPGGVAQAATLILSLSDGSDVESDDSYKTRLLNRFQRPPAGGNQYDYPQFAFKADSAVRSVMIRRFGRGLGTVDIYITTGTTDIDTAVTNGQAIVRIPSQLVIDTVQAYYEENAPLTDCPKVFAPTETNVNVTVNVDLAAGLTMSSIPNDATYNPLNLTVQQLIQREIGRVLYKYQAGGRQIPGLPGGYVVAADIEFGLDKYLSAVPDQTGVATGFIPILTDRQVQKLNGANWDLQLPSNSLAKPGTITVIQGV